MTVYLHRIRKYVTSYKPVKGQKSLTVITIILVSVSTTLKFKNKYVLTLTVYCTSYLQVKILFDCLRKGFTGVVKCECGRHILLSSIRRRIVVIRKKKKKTFKIGKIITLQKDLNVT